MDVIHLGGEIGLDEYVSAVYGGAEIFIPPHIFEKLADIRRRLEKLTAEGRVIYGLNTGFGALKDRVIDSDHINQLQHNLLRSHAVGVGEPLPSPLARGMLFLLAASLCRGYSGVRPVLVQRIVNVFNAGLVPYVPRYGSVGASGDLAPLAHMALAIVGEGYFLVDGEKAKADGVLERVGVIPSRFPLSFKEGLAMINGTHYMLSILIDDYLKAQRIVNWYIRLFALYGELMETISTPFDSRIHRVRKDKYAEKVAGLIRRLWEGSHLIDSNPEMVQDSYSIRCFPQIMSPVMRALDVVRNVVDSELNAVTDNPLVFDEDVLSGGNFHGAPLAWAAESLKMAISDIGNVSIAHMEWMLNPRYAVQRGLRPFLATDPGLESGFMILQYMAASRMAQIKVLSHPASVDNYYTSGLQEDVISLGSVSVWNLREVLENLAWIVAAEAVMVVRGISMRGDCENLSPAGRKFMEGILDVVGDKILSGDVEVSDSVQKLASFILERGDG